MLTQSTSMRRTTHSLTLVCVCNHQENAHSITGRCRVPGCPCEHYQPMPEVTGSFENPWQSPAA